MHYSVQSVQLKACHTHALLSVNKMAVMGHQSMMAARLALAMSPPVALHATPRLLCAERARACFVYALNACACLHMHAYMLMHAFCPVGANHVLQLVVVGVGTSRAFVWHSKTCRVTELEMLERVQVLVSPGLFICC